jgi:DNA-binding NtrC family response regulator
MSNAGVWSRDRVLLIDDDELVAGSLREYLVKSGKQVDVAVDVPSSVGLMDARQYGVIVVDPYLTGNARPPDHSVLETIRSLQPDAALIVLTAYGSPALAASAARLRASALLEKPQSVISLNDFVSDACRDVVFPSSPTKGQPQ